MLSFGEQAERLVALYTERALINKQIYDHEQAIEARKSSLTPAEGWPGKNEEARKAARDAAFAADDALALHQRQAAELRGRLIILQADVEGVEAERRADEWRLRERLVEALLQRGVQPQSAARVENAFDDTAQAATDQALTDAAQAGQDDPFGELHSPDGQLELAGQPAEDEWPF
jgi:hypothetical protein